MLDANNLILLITSFHRSTLIEFRLVRTEYTEHTEEFLLTSVLSLCTPCEPGGVFSYSFTKVP
jgi:hypothetical protein